MRLPFAMKVRRFMDLWRKASSSGGVVYYAGQYFSRPDWDMANEITEGYEQNSVVYACVNVITRNAAAVPWFLNERRGKEWRTVDDENHPLLQLWRRPNPKEGGNRYRQRSLIFLELTGNSFERRIAKPPLTTELWCLRPTRFEILPDPDKKSVKLYRYTVSSGASRKTEDIKPEEVMHLKLFEREDNEWWGLSPVRVGAGPIDTDNEAVKWNRNLLLNRGRPDAIFSFPEGLTPQLRADWERFITEKYSGGASAGHPMKIEAGQCEYIELSKTPQELDFLGSLSAMGRRICQCYNVPPELIGDPQNKTYSNQAEARLALVEQVILPLLDFYRDEVNAWLTPLYGDNLELRYDPDAVDVIAEKRKTAFERVLAADWLSANEQREATGYDPIPEEEADIPRFLVQQRAFSAALLAQPQEDEEEEPEEEEEEEEETPKKPPPEEDDEEEEDADKSFKPTEAKVWKLKTEEQKLAAFYQIERQRQAFQQYFAVKVQKHFLSERRGLRERLSGLAPEAMRQEAAAAVKANRGSLRGVYRELYGQVGRFFFERTRNSVPMKSRGVTERKDLFSAALREMRAVFSTETTRRVELIEDTSLERLGKVIEDGILGGRSNEAIVDDLERMYDESFIPHRSLTIADTEVMWSSNYGSRQGAKSTGLDLKKYWISQRDARVRDAHRFADNGQGIDIDASFPVGGELLQYPGDPAGRPDNVINCRCFLAFDER